MEEETARSMEPGCGRDFRGQNQARAAVLLAFLICKYPALQSVASHELGHICFSVIYENVNFIHTTLRVIGYYNSNMEAQ